MLPRPAPSTLSALLIGLVGLTSLLSQCTRTGPAAVPSATTQDPKAKDQAPVPAEAIRLLVSGSMHGRLEPCGCASGQLGGLARRMQHIGESRSYDLLIEGGDMVEGASELDLMKWFTEVQVLFGMERPYDVLGVGANDLRLPRDAWSTMLQTAPVVASDLRCDRPEWPAKPFLDKEVKGRKVRIASLTIDVPEALRSGDGAVRVLPPAEAWKEALAGAAPDALRILLLHTTEPDARKLVPQFAPAPDLVVCFDPGFVEPSSSPQHVGSVPLVFAGIRGRVLLEVALQRPSDGPPRVWCELVPLAGSKTVPGGGGDPTVKEVILDHRRQVKEKHVLQSMARQRPTPNGATYVGSAVCKSCHESAWDAFAKTRHAGAWDTLVKAEADPKRYGWPVTAYPDCVGCHVVGYGEQTGFVDADQTGYLTGVGCERCHGAGSDHVTSRGTTKLGIHGGVAPSELCVQCHDFEQSPDFVYGTKWPLIQHGREPKK